MTSAMTSTHVTINDVARAAGVSKGLVSLALNDRRGVAPETRDRILAAAQHLGWNPNPSARGLSTRRAYALGLIVRREARTIEVDPFFAAFIAGSRDRALRPRAGPRAERGPRPRRRAQAPTNGSPATTGSTGSS